MTDEEFVHSAYEIAELKDGPGWIARWCPAPRTPPHDGVACSILRADGTVTV
jgi:hypothetical protein